MKKKLTGALLACAMALALLPMHVAAAEPAGYVVQGAAQNGGVTLTVGVRGTIGYSGQLALCYDAEQVALRNGDSFGGLVPAARVSFVGDQVDEGELMDTARGYAGFAWYGYGADGTSGTPATIATMQFDLQSGVTADELDSGTFRLRYVPDEGFGSWEGPASLQGKTSGVYLNAYSYLADSAYQDELAIEFDYPGSDREPARGGDVRVKCRDLTGKPVRASLEVNGRIYEGGADGVVSLRLADGAYNYRLNAAGFGAKYGVLNVEGSTELPVEFVTDQMLVDEAAKTLEIGYYGEDTAQAVTETVTLIQRTKTGAAVAWKSSNTEVVTNSGLVYRPEKDTKVTLTATLTHGAAKTTKSFEVMVLARPVEETPGTGGSNGGASGGANGTEAIVPGEPARFGDLADVPWAQESIELLAEAGVINGTGARTFSPNDNIKRGDFLALILRMMSPQATPDAQAFADVPEGSYYYREITAARALGITNGVGNNRFEPERFITRQEMVTLTALAADKIDYLPESAARGELVAFTDAAQIDEWAQESMSRMIGRGFIVGSGGAVHPRDNTTRAEAAVFLCRAYLEHGA